MSEIIFLAILALIVIGPKELPQVARTLGRFLNELKRSTNIMTDEIRQQARVDLDLNTRPKKPVPPAPVADEVEQSANLNTEDSATATSPDVNNSELEKK